MRWVAFAQKLTEILEHEDFDVVQLEGLSMAVYEETIRQCSTAKIVLRAHNVESQIWQRQIVHEKNWLNRAYLKLQVKRLARFEKTSTGSD
ncbi:MAG: hypothetical protein U5L96_05045 [Owenweeksia sp.]|nr:hypothetical protein [Owenweeksia sp.]